MSHAEVSFENKNRETLCFKHAVQAVVLDPKEEIEVSVSFSSSDDSGWWPTPCVLCEG